MGVCQQLEARQKRSTSPCVRGNSPRYSCVSPSATMPRALAW
jgi:hypothetical protein